MTENQTDRLQQLEDVMNELQSLRTGTNVKSMIVVQSDEPNHEIIPPVPAPTVSPFSSRLTVGIGLAIVLFIFGALMVRKWQASPMTRLDQLKAATQQAATGDLNQALASVETLTDADCSPAELITAAAAFATASTKTTDDRALAEHRAARAVLFIRRAMLQGFTDVNQLKSNRELAPLQGRADFKKLIVEMSTRRP